MPPVLLMGQHLDAIVLCDERSSDRHGIIGPSVVDDDDTHLASCLPEHPADASSKEATVIVARDDDIDGRHGLSPARAAEPQPKNVSKGGAVMRAHLGLS